ncbi:MAG: hypothetical protein AAGD10_05990 [Myxococcota bacterium]
MRRMWLAGLIPLAAILFAFSLGPSPRKALRALEGQGLAPEVAYQAFVTGPAGINAILVEKLAQGGWPYRVPAARALGTQRYQPARRALERLLEDDDSSPDLRAASREALQALDGAWWAAATASR